MVYRATLTAAVSLALLAAAGAQLTVDPSVLESVFGTPPTSVTLPSDASERTPLEQITVQPTAANMLFTNEEGVACRCVPYYLCDANTNTTIDDPTITGFGEIDIRFKPEECQESIETCCTEPVEAASRPRPAPDASRLRGCGFANPRGLDFTVTGGTGNEAQFGEFPWVVALLNASGGCQGAGVLIHPSVVLTAAHTSYKHVSGGLSVRAGEWDTQTTKERLPHQERDVQEVFIHPEFNPKTLYNDVALLRLAAPLELADHINVACLPPAGASLDAERACVANGWGKDIFGRPGRYAVILKKVLLDMVGFGTCQTQLQQTRLGSRFKLHRSFVCAGGQEGRDTCEGDGGAPLSCPFGGDRYQVAGLVAWGIGCGQRGVPGVYVRVAGFRAWIDNKMADWELDPSSYVAA